MTTRWLPFLMGAYLCGCSQSPDSADELETTDGDAAHTPGACANGSLADDFVPGLAKHTESGLEVALVEADPAPPARLDNSWVLAVSTADGEPMLGAQLTLNPQMPEHGHGAPREAVVTELGNGRYLAEPVALFMPGYWSVDVSVTLGDEPTDSVQFGFCVP